MGHRPKNCKGQEVKGQEGKKRQETFGSEGAGEGGARKPLREIYVDAWLIEETPNADLYLVRQLAGFARQLSVRV